MRSAVAAFLLPFAVTALAAAATIGVRLADAFLFDRRPSVMETHRVLECVPQPTVKIIA